MVTKKISITDLLITGLLKNRFFSVGSSSNIHRIFPDFVSVEFHFNHSIIILFSALFIINSIFLSILRPKDN